MIMYLVHMYGTRLNSCTDTVATLGERLAPAGKADKKEQQLFAVLWEAIEKHGGELRDSGKPSTPPGWGLALR